MNSCEICQPSTYSVGETASCPSCDDNTNSDTVGATVCKFCNTGQIPNSNQQSCVNCDSGEFSNIGDTTCSQCVAGLYSSSGSGVCSYCGPGTYFTAASSTCTSCPGGQVSSNGAASCSDCVAGKKGDGNNNCDACPAGSFSAAGSTECDSSYPAGGTTCSDCEEAKFVALGAASCELCLAGTYSSSRAGEFSICAAGKFSSAGATSCSPCEGGFYSHGQSSGCSMCTSGKHSGDETGECSVCSAGRYSGTGAPSCAICTAGKYSQLVSETEVRAQLHVLPGTYGGPGSSVCVDCGEGTYSEVGADSCINCPGGKYSGAKAGSCVNCEAGKFSGNAAASCETCLAGQGYVSEEGQSQCEYWRASKRADSESNTCVNCDKGKFSTRGSDTCGNCEAGRRSDAGASSCNPCEPGEIAIYQVCTKCAKGEYADFGVESCSPCDGEGEYADEEGAGSCLSAPAGRKPSANRESTTPCPAGRYSLGGATECTECGPLCAVCEEGYAAVGSGADLVCNEFTGSATQTIAIGFSIIGAVIAVVVFWCCRSARGKGSIEERALRASDSLERQSSPARGMSESAREKYDAVTSFIDSAQLYFKILLAYFQVAGGLSFAFRLRFPPMFTNFMNICKNVLSLDVISLMPLGCLTSKSNFHYNMLAYTFVPFSIGILMVLASNVLKNRSSDSAKQLANKIFGTFLALLFVILPSITIKIYSNFACHEFGGYGNYLKVDYSIDCDGTEHKVFSVYAFAYVAVFPIGTPLVYFFLLRRERDLLDPGQENFSFQLGSNEEGLKKAFEERAKLEETNPSLKRLEFLYKNYEPMNCNFEVFRDAEEVGSDGRPDLHEAGDRGADHSGHVDVFGRDAGLRSGETLHRSRDR
ncbi:hypothetical protein TL16_g11009 [Triparma laevis f. inornata]|uniref:Tyrosine-protein kinase ephrin type A/B receptor-like domain-containing protein n=1 Tax=Triparma laevis f. inornata TaxID=1714386 RepID=A0A9W7BBI8_9STRA|nr:hypothetical protein TL16_g11009 [Triparma laevis f. inornata]